MADKEDYQIFMRDLKAKGKPLVPVPKTSRDDPMAGRIIARQQRLDYALSLIESGMNKEKAAKIAQIDRDYVRRVWRERHGKSSGRPEQR